MKMLVVKMRCEGGGDDEDGGDGEGHDAILEQQR
jgi:hypothetical protein